METGALQKDNARYEMKIILRQAVVALSLLTLGCATGCATSPTGRQQFILYPDNAIDSLGLEAFSQMKSTTPVNNNAKTNAYVKCIANAITRVLPEKRSWEVVVFEDKTANAFALPGGKIGVHTGILLVAKSPAQLAAVIGHEVGHVLARHSNERASQQVAAQGGLAVAGQVLKARGGDKYGLLMASLGLGAQFGVLLPFGRAQESEADLIGLELMAKAGFDPRESVTLWQNMQAANDGGTVEWLSTHPSPERRIADLQAHMNDANAAYAKAEYKPNCGL